MLTIDNITTDYLSQALGSLVDRFEAEPIGEGEGYMADLYRLTLTGQALPESIVLKLAASDPVKCELATRFNSYRRESDFYRTMAGQAAIRTPVCHYNARNPDGEYAPGEFVLLLEDVEVWPTIDPSVGAGFNEATTAVTRLAHLHASFWSPAPSAVAGFQSGFTAAASDMSSFVLDRLNDMPTSSAVAFMQQYARQSINHLPLYTGQQQVFSHMDYRLDNMRIDGNDLVLFDWGECCLAPPGFDLAYFLTTSLAAGDRHDWEEALVNTYHLALEKAGIDYSLDTLFDSYRLAIPPGFYLSALVLTSGHHEYGSILANRCLKAIQDHLPFLRARFRQ